jgi:hypothetical protein
MRIRFDGKTVEVNGVGHGFGQCDRAHEGRSDLHFKKLDIDSPSLQR